MTTYFRVENGAIVDGPRALPASWRNICGLAKASPERLAQLGWLPEDRVGHEPFDREVETRSGPVYSVEADRVVATYVVAPRTAAELEPMIKRECQRRIFAVLKDLQTLSNIGYLANELLAKATVDGDALEADESADLALARAAGSWVSAMQTASRAMVASGDAGYRDDAAWPAAPAGLADLAERL